jgi:hypothetical protein
MNHDFQSERAPHILNTSSNLLGFSFLILTSTRVIAPNEAGVITKLAAFCVVLFAMSTLISYISIHSKPLRRSINIEQAASYIFLLGQFVLTAGAVRLSIDLIK